MIRLCSEGPGVCEGGSDEVNQVNFQSALSVGLVFLKGTVLVALIPLKYHFKLCGCFYLQPGNARLNVVIQ